MESFVRVNEISISGTPNENGDIRYLDRHTITCPTGEYLSSFTPLNKNGRFQIDFKCMKFTGSPGYSSCRNLATGFNDPGDSPRYLDRHPMVCNPNEAITGFKGVTNGARQFQFTYTCCQGSINYPTASPSVFGAPNSAPTLAPTLAPVVSPSAKPTDEPSHEPTYKPTMEPSGPTLFPTIEPTMPPNWNPTWEPTLEPTFEPSP